MLRNPVAKPVVLPREPVARMERRPYVPFLDEATHPRCGCEGYPDRPGRASSKEGESCGIISKLSWLLIRRSYAMRLRLRRPGERARSGFSARSITTGRRPGSL